MIDYIVEHSLAIIRLNRLASLNALSSDMLVSISKWLQQSRDDDRVQVVLIESVSPEVFCAGGDVRELYAKRHQPLEDLLSFFRIEFQNIYDIHTYSKPIVSLMNGMTIGGGVGLGMHVAFPVAGEDMVFAMPETAIGLFPDVGVSYLFDSLDTAWKNYLSLFGAALHVPELFSLGLIRNHIPVQNWPQLKERLSKITQGQDAFEAVRTIIDSMHEQPKHRAHLQLQELDIFAEDSLDKIITSLSKNSVWASKIAQLCPLSLVITFEQMRLAKGKDLKNCLQQDYQLISHFMNDADFFEGVRACLVDKDKHPHWHYASIEEVPYSVLQSYLFEALGPMFELQ